MGVVWEHYGRLARCKRLLGKFRVSSNELTLNCRYHSEHTQHGLDSEFGIILRKFSKTRGPDVGVEASECVVRDVMEGRDFAVAHVETAPAVGSLASMESCSASGADPPKEVLYKRLFGGEAALEIRTVETGPRDV